ncbi:MAG: ubiquinone biosynthesis regulatory protein kinase UbiB [Nevskiaceae bacterium]|nr:MAG: ubiquinone biosynthesis regulatory protein kinase UbiB [Nevskiaceae bacterium]TBR73084.1 MAG: ubiquinone biosynthesis regulatory protein kinase UbiB [Nevskiaceae bacterium]
MTPRDVGRIGQILYTLRRYHLGEFAGRRSARDPRPRGSRLRMALEELGPVFVKFGQALSTRPDLLPPDVATELAQLQDRVPPFPGEEAQRIVEAALGKPIGELFESFDTTPLASASIAQVHAAQLPPGPGGAPGSGPRVVVKVLRPDVQKHVARDVAVLHTLARMAARFVPEARRLRPDAVIDEYEHVILDELDLMREGGNAALLRRNWLGSELIYHPLVFWDYTRPNVLVLERIDGICIRELAHLRALGVDFQVLAERGVEIFFRQVFRDNFFHADMHPGNIFVDASDPAHPSYQAVDFGIVGSLSDADQRYLAENFLAFFNRDYKRVAELHLESGWIPAGTRVQDFESAIRTVCEPIFEKPLKDISFGFFLLRLFQIARRFDYQVQPQLVLLQKTLLTVEGLGRQLYPELDLWKTAKPIMEDWMRARIGPRKMLATLRGQVPALAESLPLLVQQAVRHLELRGLPPALDGSGLEALRREISTTGRRLAWMIAGATFWIGAALLFSVAETSGHLTASWVAATGTLTFSGIVAWWQAVRARR